MAVTVDDLACFDLFADAKPTDLEPLAALLTPVRFAAGATVMRRGDHAREFLLVTRGEGVVSVDDQHPVGTVSAGSLVGELALLRASTRMATVSAVTEISALAGGKAAFAQILDTPGVLHRVVVRARRRLAADLRPLPATLRTGAHVWIRPVLPGDRTRLLEAGAGVSAETRYRRFFSAAEISEHTARYLTEVDYVDHFVWVATDPDHTPVGGATYIRDPRTATSAEISFSMIDEFQGQGLGTLLMGALTVAAAQSGISRFTGDVLSHNAPMRAILDRAGASWANAGDGVVRAIVDVPDPAVFGVTAPLVAGLAGLVREVSLRSWSSLTVPGSGPPVGRGKP